MEIAIATLATYGLATLISEYDGFLGVLLKLRKVSPLFECNVCLAVWVAVPIAIFTGMSLIEYLAIIGGTILLARLT